jgi:hypothetical protein
MSTDIEGELRELFREKAGEAPVTTPAPAAAPQRVLRRGRLHQVGTVAGTLVAVSAVVIGSIAGMSSLLRGGERVGGPSDYQVFERTATVEAFTVTSPSDWFLVNQWPLSMHLAVGSGSASESCTVAPSGNQACTSNPEPVDPIKPPPYGLPMFQLSNRDLGLDTLACGEDLPADGAALYVAHYTQEIPGLTKQFGPWSGGAPEQAVGPCGAGSYATFTVNDEPFLAWIGVGEAASEQDRAIVMDAFASIVVDDGWTLGETAETMPAYVVAGGEHGPGDRWRIDLRYLGDSLELTLEDGDGSRVLQVDESAAPLSWTGTDPIFGVVAEGAPGVEFWPGAENDVYDVGGAPVPGTIVGVPPTIDAFDLDLFFIDPPAGYGELGGRVIVTGSPEPTPSVSAPPVGEPRADVVELSASFEGQAWTARFKGSFADGTACVFVTVDDPYEPFCAELPSTSFAGEWPFFNGTLTPHLFLLTGSVPPAVDEIRFLSDDDAIVPTQVRCAMGPLGWTEPDRDVCAIALPSSGSGALRYLDAEGDILFEEGIGWGSAQPEVTSEWAIAEGTICGERWTLTRVRSEQGFGLNLERTGGHHLSEGMSVLGEEALPTHWVPIYGCPDPADTPSAPESIIYGLVNRQADAVWLVTGTGDVHEASLATESGDGPFVFWAILDGFHRGEIIAFDASCMEIARGSFDSGPASEEPSSATIPPVECIP